MCGRYAYTLPKEAMSQLFRASVSNDLPDSENYNVCPTNTVTVVTSQGGSRRMRGMRWGFIPHWYSAPSKGPLLINARAETIAQKPAFAQACRERRCLIPASGFYEWTTDASGKKWPWYFRNHDLSALAFAGVWQDWQDQPTCAIVSCAAGPTMSEIHHREPVTVRQKDWGKWLGEEGHGAARLMTAAADGQIIRHPVSQAVNSNRAFGPELIEPFEAD